MSSMFPGLPSEVAIGSRTVGRNHAPFFIAEVGNNHNGDYYIAKRLIEESVAAGADAVKLQKRFIDEVFTKAMRETPQTKDTVFGKTYGEYREKLELDLDEFVRLKEVAQSLGTIFFATPFDRKSVDFLEEVGVELYKIASFDNTNLPLLEYVAKKRKPIILSTGMCSLEELDDAVRTIIEHNRELVILHCVSVYPTPDAALNLRMITALQERYAPLPIGYSGHERDIVPSLAAMALGASCVERHITLDRRMPGPDHGTVSIEPQEFKAMVDGGRRIHAGLGDGAKAYLADEAKTRAKHGKSIVMRINVPKGDVFTEANLVCKSPGSGLAPKRLREVLGKRATRDLASDDVLTSADVEGLEA